MNIVHIITTIDRGGAENQLLVLVNEQISSGHNLSVIYLKGKGELNAEFISLGCNVETKIANKSPLIQLVRLRHYFKQGKFIIHCHLPRAEILGAYSKGMNCLVLSRHNSEAFFPGAPQDLSAWLSRIITLRAQHIIAISEAVKKFLLSNNELPKGVLPEVVYYGYNKENSLVYTGLKRSELGLSESDFVICTIARIVHQKDFPTLLRAFHLVRIEIANAKLIVIGDGELKEEMVALAEELQISNSVKWIGKVENVHLYLELCDLFVLTSKYEGFGLVLLEAMQSKLPIVAPRISALPEVLGENYEHLVKAESPEDFSRAIIEIFHSSNLDDLKKYLEDRLMEFESKKMAQKINDIYLRCFT